MPRYAIIDDDLESDDEHELPHPVGFGSQWDRSSWIGGDACGQCTYGLDDEDDHGYGGDEFTFMTRGSFPPLSVYMAKAATPLLLNYRTVVEDQHQYIEEDDDVLTLQELFLGQCMAPARFTPTPTKALPPSVSLKIAEKMELERRRMEQEHIDITRGVQNVLCELDRQTALVLKERQEADEARQEQEEAMKTKRKQEQDNERKRNEEERAMQQAKVESQAQAEQRQREDQQRRVDMVTAKTEYISKARKLVAQLVQVRESIEPFDKNKMVSKRRLGMKKIVGGRINTLAENTQKIRHVATEVGQAIAQAREDDEQIKEALERKDPGYTSDMARGKRYLVDLLASNTIQRIQADGFNGPRGDGFPLANMLAMVSLENKEIVPILAAHVYTVCHTAIPTLPSPKKDASEDELMESLGMLKDKHGEYETFDKFLSRTESIVTFMSNIMASSPSSHTLLGGHVGAVKWLERFLDLLPDPPAAPLPLLTAPVLHGFLSGAGHMLANKHNEIFHKQIKRISEQVMQRLDDGPIGKPSSIRLEKLMHRGVFLSVLEKFQSTLPERALPELYYGANASSTHDSRGGNGLGGSMGSGSSNSQRSAGNPAGIGAQPTASNPFGASGGRNSESTPINPFGSGFATSSPFGSTINTLAPSTLTAHRTSSSPSGFGTSHPTAEAPGTSPVGSGSFSNPSAFGIPNSGVAFGGGEQNRTHGSSFSNSRARSDSTKPPCKFFAQGRCRLGDACRFSHDAGDGGMSTEPTSEQSTGYGAMSVPGGNIPFGSSSGAFGGSAPSTFSVASPFGSVSTPFGADGSAPSASSFSAAGATSAPSSFGTSSVFGNATANAQVPSPFSGGLISNPSTFGAPSSGASSFRASSSFGTDQNNQGYGPRGGGGSSKPPCKFFAQGRCRSGDSCKFSHDINGSEGFGNSSGRGGSFGNSGHGTDGSFGNSRSGNGGNGGSFVKNGDRGNGSGVRNSFALTTSALGGGARPFSSGGFGGGSANNPFGVPGR